MPIRKRDHSFCIACLFGATLAVPMFGIGAVAKAAQAPSAGCSAVNGGQWNVTLNVTNQYPSAFIKTGNTFTPGEKLNFSYSAPNEKTTPTVEVGSIDFF